MACVDGGMARVGLDFLRDFCFEGESLSFCGCGYFGDVGGRELLRCWRQGFVWLIG